MGYLNSVDNPEEFMSTPDDVLLYNCFHNPRCGNKTECVQIDKYARRPGDFMDKPNFTLGIGETGMTNQTLSSPLKFQAGAGNLNFMQILCKQCNRLASLGSVYCRECLCPQDVQTGSSWNITTEHVKGSNINCKTCQVYQGTLEYPWGGNTPEVTEDKKPKSEELFRDKLDAYEERQDQKTKNEKGNIRQFDTGATRDTSEGKFDYEGFLCPLVVERFGEYMNKHRYQSNGAIRDSDNWQKGIPKEVYMKSAFRHFHDWWKQHRGYEGQDTLEESLCALLFNTMGFLHEVLKAKQSNQK